ncbi:hypothetical protein OS493_013337 [Desmophyllum pertusum]|uniref:G-protein coupled receptors family 1 profile domain-containing protein n=1 Tax=Desmophyllum pertusum TaxID=174260 RepID=A0A9X0CFK2_9CNID|nr:hypothetical protein OS493_013337 [Desmophyllum pertusum]
MASMVAMRFTSISTVLHILTMTIDRYICIVYALRYLSWVTKRRGFHVIAFIWLVSLFMALIQLVWTDVSGDATDERSPEERKDLHHLRHRLFRGLRWNPSGVHGLHVWPHLVRSSQAKQEHPATKHSRVAGNATKHQARVEGRYHLPGHAVCVYCVLGAVLSPEARTDSGQYVFPD